MYDLAKRADVPVSTLYATSKGKRKLKNTSVETVLKLCKAEGITVEDFIKQAKEVGIE